MFDMIVPFADYGFNASHACAYGLVAYQTAYLMAHHRVEYMAAILTSVKDDKDRKPFYLYACRGMDIEVLPPDVNESELDFAPAPGEAPAIRYGLSAVRNVGEGAVQQIIEARRAEGGFVSFADFCRKVDPSVLTKRVLESLIQAGAFDSLGYTRAGAARAPGQGLGAHPGRAQGRGRRAVLPVRRRRRGPGRRHRRVGAARARSSTSATLLRLEKEMLGQFVTDHPLLAVKDVLAAQCDARDGRPRDAGRRRPRHDRRHHRRGRRASTRSAASPTPSSGWRASRAASTSSRSPASTRRCPG